MSTPDDRDRVGDLLDQGYRAEADPDFARSLLTRLQQEMSPPPMRRWLVGGAIAAGIAMLLAVAAVAFWLHARPSAPTLAKAPTDEGGALVVRGRMVKWDAPVAEFAMSDVIRGDSGVEAVLIDLSTDLDAVRRRIHEGLAEGTATAPTDAEVSARAATLFASQLNMAAGTDMVVELGPGSGQRGPARPGRILSWEGVPDLPRWDHCPALDRTVVNVVADGSASSLLPRAGHLLRDEWGMPR